MVASLIFFIICGLVSSAAVHASPLRHLAKRGAVLTGQYDTEVEADGKYLLAQNLWGAAADPSGSQQSQATDTDGDSVTWTTSYTWGGVNNQVKSYANLGLSENIGSQTIDQISSIPVSWDWSYSNASDDLVADVSYDGWLSNTANSGNANNESTYEIMIWLSARGGASPVGSKIDTVNVAGHSWDLWQGDVGNWQCISFKTTEGEVTSFSADFKDFLTYVVSNEGVPSSQYVTAIQAGTEPFVGTATLTSTMNITIT